jgi:ankyrin repeat protein
MTNSPAAFIKAAHKGDLVAVRLFLKAGMDANSRIETGAGSVTALHAAVDGGNKEIVALLLQKGADVNATAFGKDTPLHVALGRTNSNLALVQLLLNNGANVNAVRETGGTPLMQAVVVGNVEAIGLLLSKGADVNAKEIEGYTALMFAALDGDLEVVKSLLKAKPDLEAKAGSGGRTALEMARAKGHSNVVEVLIAAEKAGTSTPAARVAYEDREKARLKLGQMGLQFTADDFIRKGVWNDDTVAVKAFLDAGMDVNSTVPNQDGGTWTALAFAAEKGNPELVKLLLSRGAKVTTELFDEASGGNLETAKLLVQQGAPTRVGYDELYGWGKAPLYNAVYKGHVDVVRFLLEHRAYAPNFESAASLDYAKSFMGTAIDQCQVEVVKVLLEHKVDCGTSETTALALKEAKEMAELTPQNSTFYKDATKSKQILELVAEAFPQKTP